MDEEAPKVWQEMSKAVSPEIFYSNLDPTKQREIDKWQSRRTAMINDNVQRYFTKALQGEVGMQRKCSSFLRFQVRALTRGKKNSDESKAKSGNRAILTVWDPTEDQLDVLKEGAFVQVKNLGVSSSLKEGILQLSAYKRTTFERFDIDPQEALKLVGCSKRRFNALLQVNMKSKKLKSNSPECPELDCAGYLLKINEVELINKTRLLLYLTDATGLLLRIEHEGYNKSDSLVCGLKKIMHLDISKRYVLFRDIRLFSYDYLEGCAVGIWTTSTVSYSKELRDRLLDTTFETISPPTKENCEFIIHKLDAGIPNTLRLPKTTSIAFGYISNFFVGQYGREESFTCSQRSFKFIIFIDCFGDDVIIEAIIPHYLLQPVFNTSLQEKIHHNINDTMKNIEVLRQKIVGSGILCRFLLQEMDRENDSYELLEISRANATSLACIHMMKETISAQNIRRRKSIS